ncbi:MAG: nickel pincer cofactor biosynthesis protein LarC [Desulfobacteraceae bacterium]|nr:nickel pincer cofactor biosynthesis protein LarC [Desulfobacteraceae bacterium]
MYAYMDCFSGISGDMTLGALVDLGLDLAWLEAELRRLPLAGFALASQTVHVSGIRATRLSVHVDPHPPQRHWRDIRALIEAAPYGEALLRRALAVFGRIAEAEAAIHGVPADQVHFHEVGGIDALVDVLGACLGFEKLGIDAVGASPLPQGRGLVRCAHGVLPVPAPATAAILKGIPVYGVETEAELVTPTGAALAAGLAGTFGPLPAMVVEAVGYGAGARQLADRPNLLRIFLGRRADRDAAVVEESVTVIETAVDDMNPEIFGHLMARLFADGALDVCWIPVQMKKNRPGTLVQVVCRPEDRETMIGRIFSETTSLGVRHDTVRRRALARQVETRESPLGPVAVKRIVDPLGNVRLAPEYEDCRRIAAERNLSLREVYAVLGKFFQQTGDVT